MVKVTYVQPDGAKRTVEMEPGFNVMEGAVRNNIPGIDGDCGGVCSCATCHVHVDPAWIEKTGRVSNEIELAMLDIAENLNDMSRLGCQIELTQDLDGLVVHLPGKEE